MPSEPDKKSLAAARTIYVGGFQYRSLAGFVSLLLGIIIGGGLVWLVHQLNIRFLDIKLLAPAVAIVVGLLLLWHLIWMIAGHRRGFSVTTDGIVNNGQCIPWSKVRCFAAVMGTESSVHLFYDTFGSPIRHRLVSSRRIRGIEYEQLVQRLRDEGVAEVYPELELGGYKVEH